MGKLKRKASNSKLQSSPKKKAEITTPPAPIKIQKMAEKPEKMEVTLNPISPSSKINIFKLDLVSCNGRDLSSTELGASDIEKIWTEGIIRDIAELDGYTHYKVNGGSEIRIQYQLKRPMSIRDVALEAEFTFERTSAKGTENIRCRVVGLSNLRPAAVGEVVKVSIIKPNFDVTPEQAIEWISRYGKVHDNHR
jgi:hypothetical protein